VDRDAEQRGEVEKVTEGAEKDVDVDGEMEKFRPDQRVPSSKALQKERQFESYSTSRRATSRTPHTPPRKNGRSVRTT
jgi:hypothetical protein